MFVAPSTVLYTNCPGAPALESLASDTELEDLSKKLLANSEGLRLQVVEKDGHYFTLNNTRLQVCQWLETRGQCHTVRIETVPLKSVPEGIKMMMTVPPSWKVQEAIPVDHELEHHEDHNPFNGPILAGKENLVYQECKIETYTASYLLQLTFHAETAST